MKTAHSDDFDFTGNRPKTNYYNDMQELNTPPIIKFFESIIDKDHSEIIKYTSTQLFNNFNDFLKTNNFKFDMSSTKFGIEIKKFNGITKKKLCNFNEITIDRLVLKNYLIEKYKIDFYNGPFIDDDNRQDI